MKNDLVELVITKGVAWLRFNRDEALNALNLKVVHRLAEHLDVLRSRPDVRVLVTSGAGRAYCAGSDVRELAGLAPAAAAAAEQRRGEVFARFDQLPQISVAMLHGYVLGGGLGAALSHDFRIAAANAILAMPEVKLGWPPPWAMARLVEAAGPATASWLLLTSERISGERAAALGVVNEAVPAEQLESRVRALAEELSQLPPAAVAATRELLRNMTALRDPRWDVAANAAFAACLEHPPARASFAAFASGGQRKH